MDEKYNFKEVRNHQRGSKVWMQPGTRFWKLLFGVDYSLYVSSAVVLALAFGLFFLEQLLTSLSLKVNKWNKRKIGLSVLL